MPKTTGTPTNVKKKTSASGKADGSEKEIAVKGRKPQKAKAAPAPVRTGLKASVVGIDGKAKGTFTLPKELFAAPVNTGLLAQAVRVFRANQRQGTVSTKTRGEVRASTRKIWKQKGTGRARHGSVKAPIFVGGGIAFGPKPRDYRLKFPLKMRRKALASALTSQHEHGSISYVDGFETIEPKTKNFAQAIWRITGDTRTLVVASKSTDRIRRGMRNLKDTDLIDAAHVNPYELLSHKKIIITKDAVDVLKKTFLQQDT